MTMEWNIVLKSSLLTERIRLSAGFDIPEFVVIWTRPCTSHRRQEIRSDEYGVQGKKVPGRAGRKEGRGRAMDVILDMGFTVRRMVSISERVNVNHIDQRPMNNIPER